MRAAFYLAGIALLLAGCAAPPADKPVSIAFALAAGDQPAGCGRAIDGLGSPARRMQLADARLYVHDVALIDRAGQRVAVHLTDSPWQLNGVALVDFEDATGACHGSAATNRAVIGTVPAGDYAGLSFVIGVPAPLNHTSPVTQAAPLDVVAMGWSWQAGRKFVKIELDPEGGVARAAGRPGATWHLHLGSTGCVGDPAKGEAVACSTPNRVTIAFPAFDAEHQQVVLDLAALFQGSDLGRDGGGALGCMSGPEDPECPPVFRQLGVNPATAAPAALRVEPQS